MPSKPIRVQRKRTKGWKMPENTISVTRPGKWGNPFMVGKKIPEGLVEILDKDDFFHFMKFNMGFVDEREDAVRLFEKYILQKLDVSELKGHDLACWCAIGKICHGDSLLKKAKQ